MVLLNETRIYRHEQAHGIPTVIFVLGTISRGIRQSLFRISQHVSFFGSVEEKERGILRSKKKTIYAYTSTSVPLTYDDLCCLSA